MPGLAESIKRVVDGHRTYGDVCRAVAWRCPRDGERPPPRSYADDRESRAAFKRNERDRAETYCHASDAPGALPTGADRLEAWAEEHTPPRGVTCPERARTGGLSDFQVVRRSR